MGKTVGYILENWLKENGYDGLFSPGECACKIGDLQPCEGGMQECEPGYLVDSTDNEFDWEIVREKPEEHAKLKKETK